MSLQAAEKETPLEQLFLKKTSTMESEFPFSLTWIHFLCVLKFSVCPLTHRLPSTASHRSTIQHPDCSLQWSEPSPPPPPPPSSGWKSCHRFLFAEQEDHSASAPRKTRAPEGLFGEFKAASSFLWSPHVDTEHVITGWWNPVSIRLSDAGSLPLNLEKSMTPIYWFPHRGTSSEDWGSTSNLIKWS